MQTEWPSTVFEVEGDEMQHESINDALRECVRACGGYKVAGCMLFPEKGIDRGHAHLLACLNENRDERLSPEHVLMLMREARDRGCHAGMAYMAATLGYSMPTPVDPRDEVAELQRRFIRATEQSKHIADQMTQATERIAGAGAGAQMARGPRSVRA